MKKILLILISFYSFSFASWTLSDMAPYSCKKTSTQGTSFEKKYDSACTDTTVTAKSRVNESSSPYQDFKIVGSNYKTFYSNGEPKCYKVGGFYSLYYDCELKETPSTPNLCPDGEFNPTYNTDNYVYRCNPNDGSMEEVPDPQNGFGRCPDLFEKDGIAYTCNPNTNQATPIPNSDGVEPDEDGEDIPKCNEGYEYSVIPKLTIGDGYTVDDSYNIWQCSATETGSTTPDTGGTGTGTETGGTGTGGTDTGGTDTPDTGTETGGGGTDTPDTGTDTETGGTGTGGGGETVGGGTGGGTTPDTDTDNGSNTPFLCDDGGISTDYYTPGMQTCDRTCESIGLVTGDNNKCISTLSCPEGEVQTGTDLLGNPICYALNTETDLNKIGSLLDSIKTNTSFNKTNNTQLGNLNNNTITTNAKLEAVKGGLAIINTSVTQTNAKLEAIKGGQALNNTALTNINDSTQANTGLLNGIGTILSDMVSPINTEKESEYETKINEKLTSTLNDSFTKYSNVLGFGSSYSSAPDNITVTLYGTEYTLIDFSLLDDFVSIIRSLFLTLAYLYGFMIFLRGGK